MRGFLVLLMLLLAGCTADPGPTPLYVEEEAGSSSTLYDPELVPDTDDDGRPNFEEVQPAWVNVTVVADDGTPIVGTGVVYRIFDCDWCEATIQEVGLRTDDNGSASLEMYAEVQVEVIAGDHSAYTTEVADRVQSVLGIERKVVVRLYDVAASNKVMGTYDLALREEGRDIYGGDDPSEDWAFHSNAEVQEGYMDRLQRVDVTIYWNNTMEASGWLRASVGPEGGESWYAVTAGAPTPTALEAREEGAHEHTISWDVAKFREDAAMPGGLSLAARLDSSILSLEGLDYTIVAEATFQGSDRFEVQIV